MSGVRIELVRIAYKLPLTGMKDRRSKAGDSVCGR